MLLHKGDYSLLGLERREARLTTPQEKEFLDLGGRASQAAWTPVNNEEATPKDRILHRGVQSHRLK